MRADDRTGSEHGLDDWADLRRHDRRRRQLDAVDDRQWLEELQGRLEPAGQFIAVSVEAIRPGQRGDDERAGGPERLDSEVTDRHNRADSKRLPRAIITTRDHNMESPKRASTDHPVHDLIAERFSPYGFSDQPVSPEEIRSLFEAARWAASSYNEQPWNFIVATADDPEAFDRLASCLVDANQDWARRAPVLALGCIRTKFSRNGLPNLVALHDLGLASANLCLEATARRDHESHWRSLSSRAPGAKRRDSWGANQSEFERQPENPPRNGEKDLR